MYREDGHCETHYFLLLHSSDSFDANSSQISHLSVLLGASSGWWITEIDKHSSHKLQFTFSPPGQSWIRTNYFLHVSRRCCTLCVSPCERKWSAWFSVSHHKKRASYVLMLHSLVTFFKPSLWHILLFFFFFPHLFMQQSVCRVRVCVFWFYNKREGRKATLGLQGFKEDHLPQWKFTHVRCDSGLQYKWKKKWLCVGGGGTLFLTHEHHFGSLLRA